MTTPDLISILKGARKSGDGYIANCPAHDDKTPSLSVNSGTDGTILLKCHAGCTTDSVCTALDIKMGDLFPNANGGATPTKRIVANYDYTDEQGNLLYQVVRYDPKDFRQRRRDASAPDGWTWRTNGVRRVLYRLPRVIDAVKRGLPVILTEGEKDADTLNKHGFVATCNAGGAGKWRNDYAESLRGADVILCGDNDEAGRKHVQLVVSKLHGVAKGVRVLPLPDTLNMSKVKDAADFFGAGGTAEQLLALIDSAPNWNPAPQAPVVVEARDIRGEIVSILRDGNLSHVERQTKIAKAVVLALTRRGQLFFHAELRDFDSAMFFDAGRKRLERIRSDAFSAWLSEWICVNRADSLFKFVSLEVETAALSLVSRGMLPEAFWASRPGAVYLSNGDGSIVKVTAAGLGMVDNGTDGVLFAVGKTLAPWKLTNPVDPFVSCSLFSTAQCSTTHGADILRVWLNSLPTNPQSKPPLCLAGDIGSGKTRFAKGIAELYGLPFVATKVEDEGERDFWVKLDQGGLFVLDNTDSYCKWFADALSSAATGGCLQPRKLYTDAEAVTLRARAYICVTTANPLFASDPGLADRLLVVRMNRRQGESLDGKLAEEILANRDAGLSHVATTIHKALADTAATPPGLNARHPDFAKFAVRIGRALNREAQVIAALQSAELDKAAFCLENDHIGATVLAYLRKAGTFTGTAADLRDKLCEIEQDFREKLSVKKLGRRLNALWPHLEKALDRASRESDRKGFTIYTFKARSAEFAEL